MSPALSDLLLPLVVDVIEYEGGIPGSLTATDELLPMLDPFWLTVNVNGCVNPSAVSELAAFTCFVTANVLVPGVTVTLTGLLGPPLVSVK